LRTVDGNREQLRGEARGGEWQVKSGSEGGLRHERVRCWGRLGGRGEH